MCQPLGCWPVTLEDAVYTVTVTRGGVYNEVLPQAIFHCILRLASQYSHSQLPLLVNIFSYSGLLLRGGPIFSRILPAGRPSIFLYCQFEDSVVAASKGNTLCLEGNIATAIFQYYIVR